MTLKSLKGVGLALVKWIVKLISSALTGFSLLTKTCFDGLWLFLLLDVSNLFTAFKEVTKNKSLSNYFPDQSILFLTVTIVSSSFCSKLFLLSKTESFRDSKKIYNSLKLIISWFSLHELSVNLIIYNFFIQVKAFHHLYLLFLNSSLTSIKRIPNLFLPEPSPPSPQ